MSDHASDQLTIENRFTRVDALCAAFGRGLGTQLPRSATTLPRPESVNRRALGVRSVPIYRIVDAPQRHADLDALLGTQLPPPHRGLRPVELWQLGNHTFVASGTQQVALARARGQVFVTAEVTELLIDRTLDAPAALALLLQIERADVALATGLEIQPNLRLTSTTPGTLTHIARQIAALRLDPLVWFRSTYARVAAISERTGVLERLPHRSAADLYHWAFIHRRNLPGDHGRRIGIRAGLQDIVALGRVLTPQ